MAADPSQLKVVKQVNRSGIHFCLAHDPSSGKIFFGGSDGKLFELDVMADKPDERVFAGHDSYVTGVVLAGEQLVSSAYDGRLIWWNRESAEPRRTVEGHQRWIRDLAATPDGERVVSVADDMVARVWEAKSGKLIHELRGHEPETPQHFPSMLYACAISADGELLATADRIGHVVVWRLDSGERLAELDAPEMYTWDPKARIHSIGGVRSLAFSPNGERLAVGGIGQIGNIDHLGSLARVEIFDWQKSERTHEFKGDTYKGLVERLEFARDGRWLMATGGDHGGFIKFLDLEGAKIIKQEKAPMHVHDARFDEEQETLFAAGHGKLAVWSLAADAK